MAGCLEEDDVPLILTLEDGRSRRVDPEGVPNENGVNYDDIHDMSSPATGERRSPWDPGRRTWEMNYQEAAIYLQDPKALASYLFVHNHLFYLMELTTALLLLLLSLCEAPAVAIFRLGIYVHATLELFALTVVLFELSMKLRWLGCHTYIRHKRTMVKTSHLRITRALRCIFLVDCRYCGAVRRNLRQIFQSLPPFIDILLLLLFFMVIFAILGFYLFSPNKSDPYFDTLESSLVNLFVLLTTANTESKQQPFGQFEGYVQFLRSGWFEVEGINILVNSRAFQYGMYILVAVNGLWILVETFMLRDGIFSRDVPWSYIMFLTIYGVEVLLKVTGLGPKEYLSSGWNLTSTVADAFRWVNRTIGNKTVVDQGYYYLNNFDNILNSFVTLFELTVVNDWGDLRNVSLEPPLFHDFLHRDHAEDSGIVFEREVFKEEIRGLAETYGRQGDNLAASQLLKVVSQMDRHRQAAMLFLGRRSRTKSDLSMKMYEEEIQEWYEEHSRREERELPWHEDEELLSQTFHPPALRQRSQTII
ncbi:hypothetical protein E2320_012577 [Naja naja]|nr:hypothetical protein E2320_012577 [Naja naja]